MYASLVSFAQKSCDTIADNLTHKASMLDSLLIPQTRTGAAWRVVFWCGFIACISMLICNHACWRYFPEFATQHSAQILFLSFSLTTLIAAPLVSVFFSMTLRLSRTNEKLREVATRDGLTGLLNRTALEDIIRRRQSETAKPEAHDDALIVIDIDHFKAINDQYGHAAGDQVLRMAGVCISGNTFERDHVARIGGEEFAVFMLNCGPNGAAFAAERIRRALADSKAQFEGETIRITASLGGALFPRGANYHGIYRSADNALYRAKRSGRDRCDFNGLPLCARVGSASRPDANIAAEDADSAKASIRSIAR